MRRVCGVFWLPFARRYGIFLARRLSVITALKRRGSYNLAECPAVEVERELGIRRNQNPHARDMVLQALFYFSHRGHSSRLALTNDHKPEGT